MRAEPRAAMPSRPADPGRMQGDDTLRLQSSSGPGVTISVPPNLASSQAVRIAERDDAYFGETVLLSAPRSTLEA